MNLMRPALVALLLPLFLTGCGGGGSDAPQPGSPASAPAQTAATPAYTYTVPPNQNDGLPVSHAGDAGFALESINEIMEEVNSPIYGGVDGIALVYRGQLILEEQLRTTLDEHDGIAGNERLDIHSMHSVSKSVMSAVFGIAVEQGYLPDLDENMYQQFPEYEVQNFDERKAATSIEDFLTMRHGLDWDETSVRYGEPGNSLTDAWNNCIDLVRCLFDLPTIAEPGEEFRYSTNATLALSRLVAKQTGLRFHAYADQVFFAPLGITDYFWGYETGQGWTVSGSALFLRIRDMAKIGQLFLNEGEWDGQQIISPAWVADSTALQTRVNPAWGVHGYGYQWWIDRITVGEGQVQGYSAQGFGGQFIYVFPTLELVAVFTGSNYGGDENPGRIADLLRFHILPAVQSDE